MRSVLPVMALCLLPVLARSFEVKGTFADGDARPAADLRVTAKPMHAPDNGTAAFEKTVRTGADGSFTIELPESDEDYTLLVYGADGRLCYGGTHLDEATDIGRIVLTREAALSGTVLDAGGASVGGVVVVLESRLKLCSCKHYEETVRLTNATDGAFAFTELNPGEYRCYVENDRFEPERCPIDVSDELAYVELRVKPGCRVEGVVADVEGKPLAGAELRTQDGRVVRSGADGAFAMGGLPEGELQLAVSCGDFLMPSNMPVTVQAAQGVTVTATVALVRSGSVQVSLQPGETGAVIPEKVQARLSVPGQWRAGHRRLAADVKEGRALFERVAPGRYAMHVTAAGMPDCQVEVDVKGGVRSEVEVSVPLSRSISGTVVDADGKPAGQLSVSVSGPVGASGDGHVWRRGETGPDGMFEISGLRTGRYNVVFSEKSGREPLTSLDGVAAGSDDVFVQLGRVVTVEGVVVNEEDAPVAGATITHGIAERGSVRRFSGGGDEDLKAGADGRFSITLREGAAYQVRAACRPYLPATTAITLKVDDAERAPLRIVLQRGASVRGIVVRAKDGAPLEGLRLAVEEAGEGRMFSGSAGDDEEERGARSDADGRFLLEGVPAGLVRVVAASAGESGHELAHSMVQTRKNEVSETRIEVPELGLVKGRVADADGKPVDSAGIMMMSLSGGGRQYQSETDAAGRFEFRDVPAGTYTVMWFSWAEGRSRQGNGLVTVVAGEAAEVALSPKTGRRLEGEFSFNGKPAGPGTLWLIRIENELPVGERQEAEIAGDGTFSLQAIDAGLYYYVAQLEGADAAAQPVRLKGRTQIGESADRVAIEASGVGVGGTVTDAAGAAAGGAWITLSPAGSKGTAARLFSVFVQADGDGRFQMPGVARGAYDVRVRHERGTAEQAGITVSDDPTTINLRLDAKAAESGE